SGHQSLVLVRSYKMAASLQAIGLGTPPQVNYGSANFVVFLTVDHACALARFGSRSFRIVSGEAGIVAHRICCMAAAVDLTARVHNGYLTGRLLEFLELDPLVHSPMFQIIVGRSRPTARYQMRIAV